MGRNQPMIVSKTHKWERDDWENLKLSWLLSRPVKSANVNFNDVKLIVFFAEYHTRNKTRAHRLMLSHERRNTKKIIHNVKSNLIIEVEDRNVVRLLICHIFFLIGAESFHHHKVFLIVNFLLLSMTRNRNSMAERQCERGAFRAVVWWCCHLN